MKNCLIIIGLEASLAVSTQKQYNHAPTESKQGPHESHTTDKYGNFKHPFLGSGSELRNIHYPDSNTFSVKLDKVPGPSRHESARKNHLSARQSASNRAILSSH